jgi:putative hydrolase of the HAD superfamily
MSRYLIWDFDGTLARREGPWTAALLEVLRQDSPDYTATADGLRPHLASCYPWHRPDQAHPVRSADQWWEDLCPFFECAFMAVGVSPSQAPAMARRVRGVYTDPRYWRLFDDTLPTLDRLTAEGWTHLALSNHVPELGALIEGLGLGGHFCRIFNSAETGYEKPHPMAFRAVQDYIEAEGEAEAVWMIGDSLAADVAGAAAAGLPAILVRRHHPDAARFCEDLSGVVALVSEATRRDSDGR